MADLPTIVIPLYYLLGGVFVICIMAIVMFLGWDDRRKYNPEGKVFIKARKKGLPVLDGIDIGSGYANFVLGVKQVSGDIAFKKDDDSEGLKVDPSLLGEAEAEHHVKGLDIYHYGSTQWMPLSAINALGFKTIRRLLGERYQDLSFLPPQEVAELLYTKSQDLLADCDTVILRYAPNLMDPETGEVYMNNGQPVKMTGRQLASIITDFREELKVTKVDVGFFAYQEAFLMNPVSHLSQDLEQLKMLIEMMLRAEFAKLDKWMRYLIMFLMVIGGVTVCVAALYYTVGSK